MPAAAADIKHVLRHTISKIWILKESSLEQQYGLHVSKSLN